VLRHPTQVPARALAAPVLVTGATGFVGSALVPALRARGYPVIAGTRRPAPPAPPAEGVTWRTCDVLRPETLGPALEGVATAFFLVHSMGQGGGRFRDLEERAAASFARAAAAAGLERIVYLGGPAPGGRLSEHLASRLAVGEILRAGVVPVLELRASMVVGWGSTSWQIVRDLSLRLPAMVLPAWLRSRTCPVALADVLAALVAAAAVPLPASACYDLPGPEVLSGREILERIAALRGRRMPILEVPLLTPRLSALWLRLVTRADYALARELVVGLTVDLLPADGRFWELIGHPALVPFDEAARQALAAEPPPASLRDRLARFEEWLVAAGGGHGAGPASPAATRGP
jgi:uncharacterized protein YbjT (DUF2867 family)